MSKTNNKTTKRRLAGAYISSVISISLLLVVVGVSSLVLVNAVSVSDYLKENLKISVMMKQDVSEEQAKEYQESVSLLPYVRETRLVSKEEGAKELEEMLGQDFLSVFESAPIPVSVDVSLKAEYVQVDSVAMVSDLLKVSPLVDEVDSQMSLVEALSSSLSKISMVFGAFIFLMLFISFVLINNMVRLSVYARRFTIYTMKLVGATRSFIRAPFLKVAVLQGLISAAVAVAALAAIYYAMRGSFPVLFNIFTTESLLIALGTVIVFGLLVCVLSTFFVVNKLVSATKDELYY